MLVHFAIDPEALFEDGAPQQEKINRLLDVWRQYGVLVTMDTSGWNTLPAKVPKPRWEDIRRILYLSPPKGYPTDGSVRKRRFAELDCPDKLRDLIDKVELILLDSVRAQEMGLTASAFCEHVTSTNGTGSFIEVISRWYDIDQSCRVSDAKNRHQGSISLVDSPENIWQERFKSMFDYSGSTVSIIDRYIVRDTLANRSALLNFLSFLSECSGHRCEVNIFSTLDAKTNMYEWKNELRSSITGVNMNAKKFTKANFFICPDSTFQHDRRIVLSNRVLEIGPGLTIFASASHRGDDYSSFSVKSMCGEDEANCIGCEVHKFGNIIDQMKVDCPENMRFTFPISIR